MYWTLARAQKKSRALLPHKLARIGRHFFTLKQEAGEMNLIIVVKIRVRKLGPGYINGASLWYLIEILRSNSG